MVPTLTLLLLFKLILFAAVTSKKVCGRPPVADGIDVASLKRVYEIGEQLILACEQGYTASKEPHAIVCNADGSWSKGDLVCAPKTCTIPTPLQTLHFGRTEVPFKSVLNYTCDEGYVLEGSNVSECLHDTRWSHPPPLCRAVSCGLPRPPRDGRIVHDKRFTGGSTIYGQSWTYECNPPKAPIGYDRGSCLATGNTTEPPECSEVSCPVPTGIANGFITFAVKREHGYKEKIRYECNPDYALDGPAEIECKSTGNWSSKPVCRAPCTVNIKRGRIFYNARKMWIADFKPNRVLHGEPVVFYCLNKPEKCGYPVATTCRDGTLTIPECFEEPGKVEYTLKPKSLPSEIKTCAANPA